MRLLSPWRPVVTITGVVYALIGLALACGGAWLAMLDGSIYYVIAGLGILITGVLLIAGHGSALWVYAAVLVDWHADLGGWRNRI
jgi:quinoprotein glucose dehydrogenase